VTPRRRWWRLLQVLLGVVVIGLAVRSLVRNWDLLTAQPLQWEVDLRLLAASAATVWAAYAILVEAWRRVVVGMRQRLAYLDAARICMLANLGRYVPGKVWSIAGAALLSRQAGVDASAAVAAAFVLQALSLASAVLVVAAIAPATVQAVSSALVLVTIVVGIAAVAGVFVLTSERALATIRRLLPALPAGIAPVPLGTMLAAFAANAVAWAAYGLAFLLLARGLVPRIELSWLQATAVFTASYVVGLVAVFAPAGIGPRESMFVLLLQGIVGPKLALALAVAARVLLTITELGAALPFLARSAGMRRQ
jgi:uncharacterized membrane protein YbhN (UPF0104 family)